MTNIYSVTIQIWNQIQFMIVQRPRSDFFVGLRNFSDPKIEVRTLKYQIWWSLNGDQYVNVHGPNGTELIDNGLNYDLRPTGPAILFKEEPFSKKRLEIVPLLKKRYYFGSPEAPFWCLMDMRGRFQPFIKEKRCLYGKWHYFGTYLALLWLHF